MYILDCIFSMFITTSYYKLSFKMRVGYSSSKKKIFILYLDRPREFFEQYNITELKDKAWFSMWSLLV